MDQPTLGEEAVIQGWWIGGVQQMLIDASHWRRAQITADDIGPSDDQSGARPGWIRVRGQDFCPLTYKSFNYGDAAYTDDAGHWISVSGWERFVRDDPLRLRSVRW